MTSSFSLFRFQIDKKCSEKLEQIHFFVRLVYEYFKAPREELMKTLLEWHFYVITFTFANVFVGAYGEVRKCLSKETNALRAVKIINKKYLEQTAE